MDQFDFAAPIKNAVDGIKEFVSQQIQYNKLLIAKKMGEISSFFVLFSILLVLASFVFLFSSFAFVWWFSINYGDHFIGYLILAGFYLVIGVLLFVFRNQVIFGPLRKMSGEIFFAKEHTSDPDMIKAFESKEKLDATLLALKTDIEDQEIRLKDDIEKIGTDFSIKNLTGQLLRNVYDTLVTTENIARISFMLVQKFRGFTTKKKGKKKRKKKEAKKVSESKAAEADTSNS